MLYDDRFSGALEAFVESSQFENFDLVKLAGGAKTLASDNQEGKDFLLDQVKTSIKLHNTKKVFVMNHSDCGGYGGLSAFDEDAEKERIFHKQELGKAKRFLEENLPGIEIQGLFVDFDAVHQII